jgi:cytochrome c biogenesis protein CcdA/thiol-disulfide isomerase/thioredoxin
MLLLVVFAFLAGLVTILSPCILPVLPIILTSSFEGKNIGKSRPLGIVLGFVLSFTFFTLFLSSLVRLSGIPANTVRLVSILIVAGLGLSLLIPQFQVMLERIFSKVSSLLPVNKKKFGFWGGIVIGLSIGILWTPCVGPILASVIALAVTGSVSWDALFITLAYSLGTAIPMFLVIVGGQNLLKNIPGLYSHLGQIQKVFGVVMILTAVGLYFNFDRKFQTLVLNIFPQYGAGLVKIEDNNLVRQILNQKNSTPMPESEIGKPMFSLLEPKGIAAPEIIAGGVWFNSQPQALKDLRGKVVLIDFWTYSCINCQRTLPYLKTWHEKYKDKGLVIIGVHSPEFEFEKNPTNVGKAIADFGLKYPIVQDNNFDTWKAYRNQYWPAKYFIDKDGFVRYHHFGEGDYDESEKVIQELLAETGASDMTSINNPEYQTFARTPETYLGYLRIDRFASLEKIVPDAQSRYTTPSELADDSVSFAGLWKVTGEYAQPQKGSQLFLNFDAQEVYLVMRNNGETANLKVYLDDILQPEKIAITTDKLYQIVKLPRPGRHILKLEFEDGNAQLFAFTFG